MADFDATRILMSDDIVERLRGVFPDCEYHKAVIETQALKKEAAAETQKEGYLRRRFAEIRKRQAEESAAMKAPNVSKLKVREKTSG